MSVGPTPPVSEFNLCPFLTSTSSYIDEEETVIENAVWTTCIENHCKFWNNTLNDCKFNLLGDVLVDILDLQTHVHSSHRHIKPHSTNNMNAGNGAPLNKPSLYASELSKESAGNEDTDSNGYIYSKHFMIEPSDENIPEVVASISIPDDFDGDFIMWEEYLDSTSKYSIHISQE